MVGVLFMFELVSSMHRLLFARAPSFKTMPRHTLGAKAPAKIQEVTLMRPIHGNL